MIKNNLPSRVNNISPFIVMDVLEQAQAMEAKGEGVIHLEVGEPDFPTPEPIKEAAIRALRQNDTHYTHSMGKLELREEICRYYWHKYRVNLSPEQIIITSGTSPAMLLVFSVLLEPGGEVILPNPYYACYPNFINFLAGKPVYVPVSDANHFKFRLEDVEQAISRATRALLINSPSNPTGVVMTGEDLRQIATLHVPIIADEIYNGLIYEGEEHSILEFTSNAFVINGFSKLFAMTGWRLGYLIAPKEFIRPMQKIQQNLFICASAFAQSAAIAALRDCGAEVEHMKKIYNQRRLFLLNKLRELGIATISTPTGAFYALADVKKYTNDSYTFAFDLLKQAKVAVTPGIDFGSNCEGYIRLSYANSLENIDKGITCIRNYLEMIRSR
ncbi:MAG: pyridoxal phosphate-dependent aminotransferase [Syntrophomonadaceae bacterium]|jgi:aspartate/methionine/tyrosine aminotransferase